MEIERTLVHLVMNASEAIKDAGSINISASTRSVPSLPSQEPSHRSRHHIRLAVEDSGGGMTRDIALHAFEPFFTTKESTLHPGLGLSFVETTIRNAGGCVFLHTQPEKGTCIELYYPILEPPRE